MFKNAMNIKPKSTLQVKPPAVTPKVDPQIVPESHDSEPTDTSNNEPRIELILNKNRIELFFNKIPTGTIALALEDHFFGWDMSRKCAYCKDTPDNREFLQDFFNAEFADTAFKPEQLGTFTNPVLPPKDEPPVVHAFTLPASREGIEEPIPDALAKYRTQVDELIAVLDIRPADLMLLAIDFLHAAKVNKQ